MNPDRAKRVEEKVNTTGGEVMERRKELTKTFLHYNHSPHLSKGGEYFWSRLFNDRDPPPPN